MATADSLSKTVELLAKTHQLRDGTLAQDLRSTMLPHASEPDSRVQRALGSLLQGALAEQRPLSLEGTLGEGGMGVVHLGTQHALGRKVAIKTLRSGAGDPKARLKLLREAWITASLEHPNILPVHDVCVGEQGEPMVVLKRIEGVTWEELMFDRALHERYLGEGEPLEHNLRILMQVCNALSLAHSRGVIHRDIKPENVMIGRFGEVYLVDWGLALSLRDDADEHLPQLSGAVEPAGTPAYMAPEMLGELNPLADDRAPAALSERTDIYLLGAVLYELVSGEPPHNAQTLIQVVSSVLLSKPKLAEGVPAQLAAVIRRCMQPEPVDRYDSAEQVRVALSSYLQHRGSETLVEGARERHQVLRAHLATAPGAAQDSEQPGKQRGEERSEHRQRAYNLFGAARFGYLAALDAWSDNDDAHEQLQEMVGEMIDHELEHGDPHAAAALLADLQQPPQALAQRVRNAVDARQQNEQRHAKLDHQLDPRVGRRSRRFAAGVMASLWTLGPLWAVFRNKPATDMFITGWVAPTLSLIVGGGLVLWARESLTGSILNRRLVSMLALTMCAQLVLSAGMELLDMELTSRAPIYLFIWFVSALVSSVTIGRASILAALGFLVSFLVSCWHPPWFFHAAAAANLFLTLVVVWVWRGESIEAEQQLQG